MMIAYTYLVNIHSMLVVVSTLFDLLFQVINCFFGQKLFDTTQEIYFQSLHLSDTMRFAFEKCSLIHLDLYIVRLV